MTINYSEDYWKGLLDETNFGGGSAGAAYAESEPANTTALTSYNYPFNETQENPTKEYIHEARESAGQAVATKDTFVTDTTITGGKIVQLFQSDYFLVAALSDAGGALPSTSWCEVFNDGDELKAAYGCYVKEEKITFPKAPELIKEEISYNAYDVIDVATDDNFTSAKAWDTTNKPACTTSISIDGVTLISYAEGSLSIVKEFSEKPAGCGLHKYPYLQKKTIEVTVSSEQYISELKDLGSDTTNLFPIVMVISYAGTSKTLTLNNMKVKESNINEIPEKGTKENSITFEVGGAFTYSWV